MNNDDRFNWSWQKLYLVLLFYSCGFYYIACSINPIFEGHFGRKEILNFSFIGLIIFSMFAISRIKSNNDFYVWAGTFALLIYSETIFWYYEEIIL